MKRIFHLLSVLAILAMVSAFLPVQSAQALSADIVISQVYGGGGNSGGVYTNDFVELFNRGTTTVSLSGWSIQYTSATGTGLFGSSTTLITPLSGSLAPGQYLLVQEAAGSNVIAPLPTPDITDCNPHQHERHWWQGCFGYVNHRSWVQRWIYRVLSRATCSYQRPNRLGWREFL